MSRSELKKREEFPFPVLQSHIIRATGATCASLIHALEAILGSGTSLIRATLDMGSGASASGIGLLRFRLRLPFAFAFPGTSPVTWPLGEPWFRC